MRPSPSRTAPFARAAELAALTVLALLALTATARAEEDCPPGSVHKAQDGFAWCEPTVCTNDSQCMPNEVCRPVGLCMEIGTLADAATADGGKRLVVTQRCAAGVVGGDPKTCPQKQTCSEMNRCVSKADAERMGLRSASPASTASSASASGAASDAKKASCACDLAGTGHGTSGAGAFLFAIGLLVLRRKPTERSRRR